MAIHDNKLDLVLSSIRSIGASFPVASSLVNAWNEHASRELAERCDLLITDLASKIEKLEGDVKRSEQECAEIFQLGLKYALNEPNKEKVPIYSSLISAYCNEKIDKDAVSNLIYECETLLPYDLETLEKVKRNSRVDEIFMFDENSNINEVSKRHASIKKLESKGLISITGDTSPSLHRVYEKRDTWPFNFYIQFFVVLHQGAILLKILSK